MIRAACNRISVSSGETMVETLGSVFVVVVSLLILLVTISNAVGIIQQSSENAEDYYGKRSELVESLSTNGENDGSVVKVTCMVDAPAAQETTAVADLVYVREELEGGATAVVYQLAEQDGLADRGEWTDSGTAE